MTQLRLQLRVGSREDARDTIQAPSPPIVLSLASFDDLDSVALLEPEIAFSLHRKKTGEE